MDESLIPRRALDGLLESLGAFRGLALQGARQVGKSTLAGLLAEQLGCEVASLDDEATLLAARDDAALFLDQLGTPAVIDEVQRAGDPLVLAIKQRLDASRRPGRYVLTGSTNFLTTPTLTESLAGRIDLVTLWPLSVGELLGSSDGLVDRAMREGVDGLVAHRGSTPERHEYLELVCAGGYPEPLSLNGRSRQRWFERYLETVLRREVETASDLRRFDSLMAMAHLLLAVTGSEFVTTRVAERIGIDRATVESHQPWLETAFLLHRLPPWSRNAANRAVRRHKIHACDTGLAAAIVGKTPSGLDRRSDTSTGPLMESFVAAELAKQLTWSSTSARLYHYRDRDQYEIDLIVEAADGRVVAVEVKSSTVARARDTRAIARMRDRLDQVDDDFVAGVVFHAGTTRTTLGDRLAGLPIADLWT